MDECIREQVLRSRTAAYFKEFTPIFHVGLEKYGSGYKALLTDLRYILNKKYLHHATIMLDENMLVVEEKFNPYSMRNSVDV